MGRWRQVAVSLCCAIAAAAALLVCSAPLASNDTTADHRLIPVDVQDGRSVFEIPCAGPADQYLVLVSSLAHQAGPFEVELAIEPTQTPARLVAAQSEPDAHWSARVERHRRQLRAARQAEHGLDAVPQRAPPAAERVFWIMVRGDDYAAAKNYVGVRGRLALLGEHCAAYVDADCKATEQLDELVRDAVRTFDREVQPTAVRSLGRHRDVDGDGKFTILFSPWLGRLSDGTVSLGGFVRGSDFYPDVDPPWGNRCDMMYLNAELQAGPHLRTLIAHEYTHAVMLSEHVFGRYMADRIGQEEESWLDEAVAHVVENLHGYSWTNLDYRISAFLSAPERYRLVVDDYFAADLWRAHGNRGSTYMFLRWCVDQYGDEILRDLVQTNLCGIENIEAATGRPFPELFRHWSAALFLSHTGLAACPEEQLRFLNPRSPVNGRQLAGPRHEPVRLSGDGRRFSLVGTSTKYLVAHSPAAAGARVRISADAAARLQVSLRRLPARLGRLHLNVSAVDPNDTPFAARRFRIVLEEQNGSEIQLESVAWERSATGSNRDGSRGFASPVGSPRMIEDLFGARVVPAGGTITADMSLDMAPASKEPLLLKVTGRDAAGHALSAWCTIEHPPVRVAGGEESNSRQRSE